MKTSIIAAAATILSACTAPKINSASITGSADVVLQDREPGVVLGIEFEFGCVKDIVLESECNVAPAINTEAATVQPILDLIGFTEGTDKGDGYNETLAYGTFTNGDLILTDMTLAEIDALQTAMLRHEDNYLNSSAIGRYQIVRTTLRTLKQNMHLDDGLVFDNELQDRLAIELLRGRGYEAWKEHRISDEQFALNLSKEWASLPDPRTGEGFYSGQNAAVSFAQVQIVFDEVR